MWFLVTPKGQRVAVRSLPALVGSDRSADVVLPHPSIAPRHARLRAGDEGDLLVDAEADAYVEVGGWQVREAGVKAGDEIVLGQLTFRVERIEDADPSVRAPASPRVPAARTSPAPTSPAAARAARAPTARAPAAQIRLRGKQPLLSARSARRGVLHTDLSQLGGGARLLVWLALLALAAGLLYGVQWLVTALM